jgi:hypothetical protein
LEQVDELFKFQLFLMFVKRFTGEGRNFQKYLRFYVRSYVRSHYSDVCCLRQNPVEFQ